MHMERAKIIVADRISGNLDSVLGALTGNTKEQPAGKHPTLQHEYAC